MKRPHSIPVPLPSRLYYGWVIVGVALMMNLAASTTNQVTFSFFIGPMSEDLGWGRSTLSWALTFSLVAGGITALWIGALVDRWGARWLGALAGLVTGGSLVGLAFTHHVWYLYLLFAILGAAGLGGPVGVLLTAVPPAKWFQAQRGRALAIATVGMPGGTALAIPLTQWLIGSVGWRQAWAVLGIIVAALVVPLCALFMRRQPEDLGLQPDGAEDPTGSVARANASPSVATDIDWTAGQALRSPTLWLIVAALALLGVALSGTLVHRVAFWRGMGMSPTLVALGTALDPFTVIFSTLAFGVIAERVPTRRLGLIGGVGLALSMLPMVFATGHAYSILAYSLVWGIVIGAYVTVNNLIWPNYFGNRFLGTIRGISSPVVILATGLGAPLYGYLLDAGLRPSAVWALSLGLFAVAGVLLFLAKPPRLAVRAASAAEAVKSGER